MKQLSYILSLGCVLGTLTLGCQISTSRGEGPASEEVVKTEQTPQEKLKSDVRKDERYNLAEDRAKFDELRKDIPPDTKIRNDERSLYMEWMSGYRTDPSSIRMRFSNLVSKKRENFNKDMNKIREEYSKDENKRKESFSKQANEDRNDIKNQDVSRDRRAELYNELEAKRKDFYSKIREDRDSFESDYRQKRKDFEEYIKEKSDVFYAELKEYTTKFNELKKQQGK